MPEAEYASGASTLATIDAPGPRLPNARSKMTLLTSSSRFRAYLGARGPALARLLSHDESLLAPTNDARARGHRHAASLGAWRRDSISLPPAGPTPSDAILTSLDELRRASRLSLMPAMISGTR